MRTSDLAQFIERLAEASGHAILPHFRTAMHAADKSSGGDFDPVTEADRAAERAMRQLIAETFPDHGVIGEEFGEERADAEYVWVLDPIDGTKSFIAGLPVWGTLIGLLHDGRPLCGAMHQPFTRELFSGDGASASWRGVDERGAPLHKALHVRPCRSLDDAVLMTTHPALLAPGTRPAFEAVETQVKLSRYGGDCYAYCVLAGGHIDLVIESGLKPHDIVALIPIVEGAGGVITDWSGGPAASGGAIIAAGDRGVHQRALEILNRSADK